MTASVQGPRSDGLGGPWPSLWQRSLYGLGAVLGRYLWTRAEQVWCLRAQDVASLQASRCCSLACAGIARCPGSTAQL